MTVDLGMTAEAAGTWSMPPVVVVDEDGAVLAASDETLAVDTGIIATAEGSWST